MRGAVAPDRPGFLSHYLSREQQVITPDAAFFLPGSPRGAPVWSTNCTLLYSADQAPCPTCERLVNARGALSAQGTCQGKQSREYFVRERTGPVPIHTLLQKTKSIMLLYELAVPRYTLYRVQC